MINLKPLTDAGLTHAEISVLLRVTRATVTRWCGGHHSPHPAMAAQVAKLITLVNLATLNGHLPLSDNVPREKRGEAIAAALRNARTPAPATL